ncbi:MAG: hypothetical protein KDA61_05260 [Planctomycetales bacterium]|nr:hypothetical protein [Planctomycetales bacterium]
MSLASISFARRLGNWTALFVALVLGTYGETSAARTAENHTIEVAPACVFSGETVELIVSWQAREQDGPLHDVRWSLLRRGRRIDSGFMTHVVESAEAGAYSGRIKLESPVLEPGVTLATELHLSHPGNRLEGHVNLHIFSPDAFAHVDRNAIASLLHVFDPEGATAHALDAADIAYRRIDLLGDVDTARAGLLLVGEGAALDAPAGLWSALLAAAQRGVDVAVFAPASGKVACEFLATPQNDSPVNVIWGESLDLRRYDERFEERRARFFENSTPRRGFSLACVRNRMHLQFGVEEGWSSCEFEFATPATGQRAGRLSLSCLPLASQWHVSPVPRYLLLHLLDRSRPRDASREVQSATNP